jgi:hypothetical protein
MTGAARAAVSSLPVSLLAVFLTATAWAAPSDAGAADERPAPGMKARLFQVKHRDADDLVEALRPLMSDGRGSMLRKSEALKTITARDFPDNLNALEQAIKRLDVPKPTQADVEVQIRVLIGAPQPASGQHYPSDLEAVVKQLGNTLPYKGYYQIASIAQRLRAGSGTSGKGQVLVMPPAAEEKTQGHFHYHLENLNLPAAANPGSGPATFALKRLKLVLETEGLGEAEVSTGLTLREGEKVVVGTGSLRNRAMIVVFSARVVK